MCKQKTSFIDSNCNYLYIKKVCCFTGHRSQKLPWSFNEQDERCLIMKEELYLEIEKSINEGYDTFLCGMALGFDMICAETVLQLKLKYKSIKLIGAIPCKNQTEKWKKESIDRYNKILSLADKITYTSNSNYYNGCMQKRNQYMIDNSNLLIAVFNGSNGGTKQTIEYAYKNKIKVFLLKI